MGIRRGMFTWNLAFALHFETTRGTARFLEGFQAKDMFAIPIGREESNSGCILDGWRRSGLVSC